MRPPEKTTVSEKPGCLKLVGPDAADGEGESEKDARAPTLWGRVESAASDRPCLPTISLSSADAGTPRSLTVLDGESTRTRPGPMGKWLEGDQKRA